MHGAARRRIHDHKRAVAEQRRTPVREHRCATQSLAAADTFDKIMELTHARHRSAQRRAGELKIETDRGQALFGGQVGAHHAAHGDIRHEADGSDIDVTLLVLAVRPGVHLHLDPCWTFERETHP